jgi:hypothetical protein
MVCLEYASPPNQPVPSMAIGTATVREPGQAPPA